MSVATGVGEVRRDPLLGLLAVGAMVGAAIQLRLGRFDGLALGLVVLGFGLLVALVPRLQSRGHRASPWRVPAARVLLVVHVAAVVPLAVAVLAGASPTMVGVAVAAACLAVVTAWDQLGAAPRTTASGHLLVVAVGVLGVCWLLSQGTTIDVFSYQQTGAERVLAGESPWAPGYPNPYDAEESREFFGPGLADADTVDFGFPYPPLSLVLSTLGHLTGDLRVAHLAAVLVAGWLLLHGAGRAWPARAGGVLLLTSPMLLPTVQRGWTETFLIAGAVATVLVLRRADRDRTAYVALGLFLALKQYAAMFLPVLVVVTPRWRQVGDRWRAAAAAVGVAVVVTLPLALWGFADFLHSVVTLQLHQPFRADAMSLPALLQRVFGWPGEAIASVGMVLALVGALGWVLVRAPRTWVGASAGMATLLLAFLLFNKQAFTNYYMLAVALVWLAVAVHDGDEVSHTSA